MSKDIAEIIKEYREKRIEGKIIDLVPFSLDDSSNVVRIRNKEKIKYFLNQTYELSIESQERWYKDYLTRNNDIYWSIYNKKKDFIGTIRIYDIDKDEDICVQGSFIIDEEQAEGAPYALEAEILSLDFVFNQLEIHKVINEDRADNKVMNNLTKKLGFEFEKNTEINNIAYKYYVLKPEAYKRNRDKFQAIIDYWMCR